jgi:FkbM family methyltransferase
MIIKSLKLIIKMVFRKLGVGVTSYQNLMDLKEKSKDRSNLDLRFIQTLNKGDHKASIELLSRSKSQIRQDIFVLTETNYKKKGFFVEFGATNGIDSNNTYLLETEFSWTGILVEPAKVWIKELTENRPNAIIDNSCVWKQSNITLPFFETDISYLSTIEQFSSNDDHRDSRLKGKRYQVNAISLQDLLYKHSAPEVIDYLSIDTEGSEFEIIEAFDFSAYNIRIITIEHNFTIQREKIFNCLTNNGYERVYQNLSDFDDWYVRK